MNKQSPVEEVKEVVPVENNDQAIEEVEEVKEHIPSQASISSLIIQLHQVMDDARNLVSQNRQYLEQIKEREQVVSEKEQSVSSREKGIIGREEACQKIENVISMQKNAKDLLDSANLRINQAAEAERKLNQSVQEQTEKISQDRLLAQKEANNVIQQRRDIDKEVTKRVNDCLKNLGFPQGEVAAPIIENSAAVPEKV